MDVNEANSQAMGRNLRQSNHTSAEKKESNDISVSLSFFFLISHYHIIRSVHLSHPHDGKRACFLSVELFGRQLAVRCAD